MRWTSCPRVIRRCTWPSRVVAISKNRSGRGRAHTGARRGNAFRLDAGGSRRATLMRFTAAAGIFLMAAAATAAAIGLRHPDAARDRATPWTENISFCPGRMVTPDVLFCDDFEDSE